MAGNNVNSAATHLGRQMNRDRLAHGWSLRELSARTGIDFATLSRVENGKRPPTEKLAASCDRVFPERRGWYSTYYEESKSWVPAGFRSWAEYEDKAVALRVWAPTIIHGLLETGNYARVMLSVYPGVSDEVVAARLASRMQRQQRILHRADPPDIHVIVDEAALYRRVGSAKVMAEQMAHLLELAALDHVRLQIMPAIEHPCNPSEMIIADDAVYTESLTGGGTHTGTETVARLGRLFATLAGECYRVSESRLIVERMRGTWSEFGERARTQAVTEVRVLKSAKTA
jgi:lambda repressor-like predicted transcriptional regulator